MTDYIIAFKNFLYFCMQISHENRILIFLLKIYTKIAFVIR